MNCTTVRGTRVGLSLGWLSKHARLRVSLGILWAALNTLASWELDSLLLILIFIEALTSALQAHLM